MSCYLYTISLPLKRWNILKHGIDPCDDCDDFVVVMQNGHGFNYLHRRFYNITTYDSKTSSSESSSYYDLGDMPPHGNIKLY